MHTRHSIARVGNLVWDGSRGEVAGAGVWPDWRCGSQQPAGAADLAPPPPAKNIEILARGRRMLQAVPDPQAKCRS